MQNKKRLIAASAFFAGLVVVASCGVGPKLKISPLSGGVDSSIPMTFALSPEQIAEACQAETKTIMATVDKIAAQSAEAATFENTVLAFETAGAVFGNKLNPVNFLKYVSDNSLVRASADACETQVSQLNVDLYVRQDLYKVIKAVANKKLALSAIDQKLLDDTLSSFKRNGLELPNDKRAEYVSKKKQVVKLEADFSTNLNEYKDELLVAREELTGMDEGFLNGLEQKDGKLVLTMSYPHYYPVMENCKNANVRKRFEFKFNNRGGEKNRQLLEEAVKLRHELAALLGYKSHAAFVLEKRMAKTPETVENFLKDLVAKLTPVGQANLAEMLELKKQDDPAATTIDAWDWRYYDVQLKKQKTNIDAQKVKEYFPLDVVTAGMFEIYETMLGVKFEVAPELPKWHDSVLPYRVLSNGRIVAYFYMDLFPRPGKYGHAAAFTLIGGYTQADGKYRAPISSIVANYNPPSGGKPSLLSHSEVETQFHEFGHIMHQVLTRAAYATYSGTSVARDFVEAPSQMLENWVWEKEPLAKLSGHYLNKSEKLPADMVKKLIDAKLVNAGVKYLRQAALATLDLEFHNSGAVVDTTAVYAKAFKDVMLVPIQDGTYPQANFGHLMGGYDSGYYGYLWSEVYAQDMYTRFEKEGLLSAKVGADYRKWILEAGGTEEAFDLLKGFIGREPNQEAFLKKPRSRRLTWFKIFPESKT